MADDSYLLGQLAEEFIREAREGKFPEAQVFADRYPELAEHIRGLFPTLLMLEGYAQDSVGTHGFLSEGQRFGEYQIIRLLGKGGFGEVYEAEHLDSGRRVALKILRQKLPDEAEIDRFLCEGRLAASINHPNSVYIYASEVIDGVPAISMELLPGGTLKDVVEARGPLPVSDAVDAILQVIDGLAAAARTGTLHRDIKPSNCFIDSDGTVKVGDFGLSISTLAREKPLSMNGRSFCGTPAFSSPEQLRCENLDMRSDIYSVGATLYYLLTGRVPLQAEGLAQLWTAILESAPPSPRTVRSGIPRALARIVLRCLKKRAGARYPTYHALKDDLCVFSSKIPKPAPLGMRFLAAAIDAQVIWLLSLGGVVFGPLARMFSLGRHMSFTASLEISAVVTLYFALWESIAGASCGKIALALRVAGLDGRKPTFRAATVRAFLFSLAPAFSYLLACYIESRRLALLLPFAVLYCCISSRNGFSGLHDLASKTRVVYKSSGEFHFLMPDERENLLIPVDDHIGPYGILGRLRSDDNERLVLGYDAILHRSVWIVLLPEGSPALSQVRRQLGRPTRLRWLNGKRNSGSCWDAYEAPRGKPLLDVLEQGPSWGVSCGGLVSLAEELRASQRDNTLPSRLTVDEVWIRQNGRLMLLDFPAPSSSNREMSRSSDFTAPAKDSGTPLALLRDVIHLVLHAGSTRKWLDLGLRGGQLSLLRKLEQQEWQSLEPIVASLQDLNRKGGTTNVPRIDWSPF